VLITGGPFTVGTLDLNNDVSGGFTFVDGTLQLAGPATINVQSHNLLQDFEASAYPLVVAWQRKPISDFSCLYPLSFRNNHVSLRWQSNRLQVAVDNLQLFSPKG
jgi:hypothetical protein